MSKYGGNLVPATIDVSKREDYEKGAPIRLIWTSDWHLEAQCCDYDAIGTMLKTEAKKPNTVFANGGDWLNFVGIQHPHAVTAMGGTLYEYTRQEFLSPDWIDLGLERIHKFLKIADGKFIMLHSGNHDRRFETSGKRFIADIARDVGAAYGGVQTFWNLRCGRKSLRILSGHGYGGGYGEYTGALANKLSRMLGRYTVDLILLGHYHQGVAVDEMESGANGAELHKSGAISPSMLRVYKPGQINYWGSRFGPYRGVGYVLVKWSPDTGFFKPEVVTIPPK